MLDANNNNDAFVSTDNSIDNPEQETDIKVKPHVIRRNIEDYLEQRALERRLKDVFDDDFLLD